MEYLAEIYVSSSGGARFAELVARVCAAATELSAERIRVRCVRAIFVPSDETCFCLFDAESEAGVHEASRRAGVPLVRVADAVFDQRSNKEPQ